MSDGRWEASGIVTTLEAKPHSDLAFWRDDA